MSDSHTTLYSLTTKIEYKIDILCSRCTLLLLSIHLVGGFTGYISEFLGSALCPASSLLPEGRWVLRLQGQRISPLRWPTVPVTEFLGEALAALLYSLDNVSRWPRPLAYKLFLHCVQSQLLDFLDGLMVRHCGTNSEIQVRFLVEENCCRVLRLI